MLSKLYLAGENPFAAPNFKATLQLILTKNIDFSELAA